MTKIEMVDLKSDNLHFTCVTCDKTGTNKEDFYLMGYGKISWVTCRHCLDIVGPEYA